MSGTTVGLCSVRTFFLLPGYTARGPWPLFSFLIYSQSVGLSQGLYLNTGQHKHRKTHTKHTCPKRDSRPRSRRPSERRQVMLP
jgi:hypothetical protein